MYSSPPAHGAAIVEVILGNAALYAEWRIELKAMADRIMAMRQGLHQALVNVEAPGKWYFILQQIGMFSYTGLTKVRAVLGLRVPRWTYC